MDATIRAMYDMFFKHYSFVEWDTWVRHTRPWFYPNWHLDFANKYLIRSK